MRTGRSLLWLPVLLCLLIPTASLAKKKKKKQGKMAEPDAALLAEANRAAEIGRQIYRKDQAAIVGTDALVAADILGNDERLRGWLTVERETGFVVRWIGEIEDELVGLYDVTILEHKSVIATHDPPVPLPEEESAMFRSILLARGQKIEACSRNYNTLVLPASLLDEEGWLVYLLAASTTEEMYVGGHYRFHVSVDGRDLLSGEMLSMSCLTLPAPEAQEEEVVASLVSHVISQTPIETHVFLSLDRDLPLFVATEAGVWKVEAGEIEFIDTGNPKKVIRSIM